MALGSDCSQTAAALEFQLQPSDGRCPRHPSVASPAGPNAEPSRSVAQLRERRLRLRLPRSSGRSCQMAHAAATPQQHRPSHAPVVQSWAAAVASSGAGAPQRQQFRPLEAAVGQHECAESPLAPPDCSCARSRRSTRADDPRQPSAHDLQCSAPARDRVRTHPCVGRHVGPPLASITGHATHFGTQPLSRRSR